jgi:16S rRNA G966 N2-methylase RsmD
VIKAIKKAGILDEKGLIICEHHIAEKMPEELHGYKKTDERIYKTKVMTFYTE